MRIFTNRSLKQSAQTDLVPRGIGNVMEAILEMLYNLTEGSAGKWAKAIFPWFATIMIYVLFANLLKLIPGFESIGLASKRHMVKGSRLGLRLVGNLVYADHRNMGSICCTRSSAAFPWI